MSDTGEPILVIDVPLATTPEQAAAILNEPQGRGYYLTTLLGWPGVPELPGVGARAFFKLRVRGAEGAATPTLETRALQFLRDNRELPVTQLCAGLKALKFPRSPHWVREKLRGILMAERRIS